MKMKVSSIRTPMLIEGRLERTETNLMGGNRWRHKPQAPAPQAPVRNRQTRKVANAKVRIG